MLFEMALRNGGAAVPQRRVRSGTTSRWFKQAEACEAKACSGISAAFFLV